jgi:hypothetical protein
MKLKNINGTSANKCSCGSWLDHWAVVTKQVVPHYCPVSSCLERAEVGAHVQKDGSADASWYVVPLCKKHNAAGAAPLEVGDGTAVASANVAQTCGKAP